MIPLSQQTSEMKLISMFLSLEVQGLPSVGTIMMVCSLGRFELDGLLFLLSRLPFDLGAFSLTPATGFPLTFVFAFPFLSAGLLPPVAAVLPAPSIERFLVTGLDLVLELEPKLCVAGDSAECLSAPAPGFPFALALALSFLGPFPVVAAVLAAPPLEWFPEVELFLELELEPKLELEPELEAAPPAGVPPSTWVGGLPLVAEALGDEAAPPPGVPPSPWVGGLPLVAEALELQAAPPAGVPPSMKEEGLPLVAEALEETELELGPEPELELELEATPPAGVPSSCREEGLPLATPPKDGGMPT